MISLESGRSVHRRAIGPPWGRSDTKVADYLNGNICMKKTIIAASLLFLAQNSGACGPQKDLNPTVDSLIGNYVISAYLANDKIVRTLNAEVTVELPKGGSRTIQIPIVVKTNLNFEIALATMVGSSEEVAVVPTKAAAIKLINDLKSNYCGKTVTAGLWQYPDDSPLKGVIQSDEQLRKAIDPNEESKAQVMVKKLQVPYYRQPMDAYSMCSSSRGDITIACD